MKFNFGDGQTIDIKILICLECKTSTLKWKNKIPRDPSKKNYNENILRVGRTETEHHTNFRISSKFLSQNKIDQNEKLH